MHIFSVFNLNMYTFLGRGRTRAVLSEWIGSVSGAASVRTDPGSLPRGMMGPRPELQTCLLDCGAE